MKFLIIMIDIKYAVEFEISDNEIKELKEDFNSVIGLATAVQ